MDPVCRYSQISHRQKEEKIGQLHSFFRFMRRGRSGGNCRLESLLQLRQRWTAIVSFRACSLLGCGPKISLLLSVKEKLNLLKQFQFIIQYLKIITLVKTWLAYETGLWYKPSVSEFCGKVSHLFCLLLHPPEYYRDKHMEVVQRVIIWNLILYKY